MSTDVRMAGPAGAQDSMPPQRPFKPLAVLRRRRLPMILAFVSALLIAIIVAVAWPPTYLSSATILIEQQEMPVDLVRSTISSYADQRLQMINQRVMTTDNLLRIIDRYNLYPDQRNKQGREKILRKMREDMAFRTISADVIDPRQGKATQATIAFSVGYKAPYPQAAAQVASELSSLYLEENLATRRRLTEETTSFLTDEANKLSKRITELDAALAKFKEEHVNTVPERESLNVQLLTRADEEKRELTTRLSSIDQQLVYLDAQLIQINPASQLYTSTGERVMSTSDRLKVVRTQYAQASAVYAPDHPDVLRLKREMEGLEKNASDTDSSNDQARQLEKAEADLALLRQRYAPDHPDVLRAERLVTSLKDSQSTPAAQAVASRAKPESPDNPAYIQLRAQREALTNERNSLEAKRKEIGTRSADLEKRLEASPAIERAYMTLARDLESTQAKYREVSQKRMEAQLAESLELERKGERFTLIEPPLPPEEPTSPNRPLILTLGFMLSLGAAIGIAFLLEALDTTIRDRADVLNLLTAAPLAIVPWLETTVDRAARRRRQRLALIGSFATMILCAVLVHFLYRPLDVLWLQAVRRLSG